MKLENPEIHLNEKILKLENPKFKITHKPSSG